MELWRSLVYLHIYFLSRSPLEEEKVEFLVCFTFFPLEPREVPGP